jgi:hypothetical protein
VTRWREKKTGPAQGDSFEVVEWKARLQQWS